MTDNPILAMGLLLVLWAGGMFAVVRYERRTQARLTSRQLRRRGGLR